MPAKIRTIKADVELKELEQAESEEATKSVATFEFNRSLDYKGGTSGKMKITLKASGALKVTVKQDLNSDGGFSADEIIYKGKIKNFENVDHLINFKGTVKVKKQMHSCNWDIQKNPETLACTLDYVPEYTQLKLIADADGSAEKMPQMPFYYSHEMLAITEEGLEAASIGGGGGASTNL